jgi:hypothetical protein
MKGLGSNHTPYLELFFLGKHMQNISERIIQYYVYDEVRMLLKSINYGGNCKPRHAMLPTIMSARSMLSSVQKGLKISPINTVGKRGR